MIAIQGPKAVAMCDGLFEADHNALKYYYGTATRCRGKQCVVSRTGYTGEDGFEVMMAADALGDVWDELVKRGALPCGLGARDSLRLEAAMPLYGHELSEEIDPFQAGLSWAVKPAKADFAGKAAMLKLKEDVSRPVRVGLVLDGTRAAREGCKVVANGKTVGTVTSGTLVADARQTDCDGLRRTPVRHAGRTTVDRYPRHGSTSQGRRAAVLFEEKMRLLGC